MSDPTPEALEGVRARALRHDEHGETPLRKRIGEIMVDGDLPEWAAEQLDELARGQEDALQSEREAAAAEAVAQYQQKLMYLADAIKTLDKALADVASPPAPQEETR